MNFIRLLAAAFISVGIVVGSASATEPMIRKENGAWLRTAIYRSLAEAPTITTPPVAPAEGIYAAPASFMLSAEVSSAEPVTYQWTKDGAPLADGPRISGATSLQLTFATTTADDTGEYTFVATNAGGSSTASTYLLVRPLPDARDPVFASLSAIGGVSAFCNLPHGRMLVAFQGSSPGNLSNLGSVTGDASLACVNSDGTVANLGFDPFKNKFLPYLNGEIRVIFRQPDGRILIGGGFTTVNGTARRSVARLNADGSLDSTFDPGVTASVDVSAFHLDTTGRLYVGGGFTNFAGVAGRSYLVRLDAATGALDSAYTPGLDGSVDRLLPLPDGGFLAGGRFINPQRYLGRFDANGARVSSYLHAVTKPVTDLAFTPDGLAFYASSDFSPYLQRFFVSDGAVDSAFTPVFSAPSPNYTTVVSHIDVQPDGKIVAAGTFDIPGTRLARITPAGEPDPLFSIGGPLTNSGFNDMTLDPAGRIWVGGFISSVNGITANGIAVLEGDIPALAWASHPSPQSFLAGDTVTLVARARATASVTYQWYRGDAPLEGSSRIMGATTPILTILDANPGDEGVYSCRATTTPSGTIESGPAELVLLGAPEILVSPLGGPREAFAPASFLVQARGAGPLSYQWFRGTASSPLADIPGATSAVYTISAPAPEDTAYYGVRVTNSLGATASPPVLITFERRLGGLATIAPTFSAVNAVSPFANNSYVVGGDFAGVGSGASFVPRRGLARILSNGTLDTGFPLLTDSDVVQDMVRDSQGRLIVVFSGDTISADGTSHTRHGLARILPDGTLDPVFVGPSTAPSSQISCLAVDSADRIYLGGSFTSFGGVSDAHYLVRLDPATGAHDGSFMPVLGGVVHSVLPLADGTVLVGGSFGLKRLDVDDGSEAAGFTYAGFNFISAILPVPDSTDFILGTVASGLERITNTGSLVTPFPASGASLAPGVTELLALPSGHILAGRDSRFFNGTGRECLEFILPDGTRDAGLDFGSEPYHFANSIAYDASTQRILVGGQFQSFRGQSEIGLVILAAADSTPADPLPPSSEPTGAPVLQAPSGISQSGFTLSWAAVPGATGYTVEVATNAEFTSNHRAFHLGIGELSLAIDSLASGTLHHYRVTAQGVGGVGLASEPATVSTTGDTSQIIDFAPPANLTFGDAPITLSATASSGLPVVLELVSGPGSLSASTLTVTGAGDIVIRASQAGDAVYSAVSLERTVVVAKKTQTITFPEISSRPFTSPPFALGATSDSGLAVSYAVEWGPASVSDGILTITGAGLIRVSARQDGDANHLAATPLYREFSARLLPQEILFTQALPNLPVDAAPFELSATASPSGLPVSFAVSGPATLTGNTLTLTGAPGSVTIIAKQAGNSTYSPAADITRSFVVGMSQEIDFPAIPTKAVGAPPFELAATAIPSGLPVAFSVVSGPATLSGKLLTLTGTGTVVVQATQAGNFTYLPAAPKLRSFEVRSANQTITFAQPAPRVYGEAPFELDATATSGLPVAFEIISASPAGIAVLNGTELIILGAGKVSVKATQPGGEGFDPAPAVTRTVTIRKADLAVSFDSASRLVRADNPPFPPRYAGFVNGDDSADLDVPPAGRTTATRFSPAGEYPITFSGGRDANYRFVAGEPAFLTVEGFGGSYEALLVDDSGIARGKLALLVPNNALTYTGTLNLASLPAAIPMRGNLAADDGTFAQAAWSPAPASGIAGLSLGFEIGGAALDGELSFTGASPATLSIASGSRVFIQRIVAGKKQKAPWTGRHTLVLRDPTPLLESDTRALPLGAGHASVSVASTGVMTFKGKLADGIPLTGTARPAFLAPDSESTDGLFRVFLRPYARRLDSFVSGELPLVPHTEQQRFPNRFHVPETPGLLAWTKGPSPARPLDPAYRAGFAAKVSAALDPWLPPLAATASAPAITLPELLGLLPNGSGTDAPFGLDFLGDFLTDSEVLALPASLTLRANGSIRAPSPNPRAFHLSVTPATGALIGSFSLSDQINPPPAKPVTRKVTISGTLRQGPAGGTSIGHAHYLLDPAPADSGPAANEKVSAELTFLK